jgi:hypothetical protein
MLQLKIYFHFVEKNIVFLEKFAAYGGKMRGLCLIFSQKYSEN